MPAHPLARALADRIDARAALYATTETPPSPALAFLVDRLEPDRRAALERLRHAWHARLSPFDEAERTAVDAIVTTLWRQGTTAALEDRLLAELLDGRNPEAARTLSLLCRYRTRLEKDRQMAERDLAELVRLRPTPLDRPGLGPERLEWLAAKLRLDRQKAEARDPRPESPARQERPEPRREPAPATDAEAPTAPDPTARQPTPEPARENAPIATNPAAADPPARPDPLGPRPEPSLRARLLAGVAPLGL
ncbi:MAG: hypothetical protein KatS3mg117_1923 [Geminicoccaceae bacterium]|nr:MAG: hypothetical protein KatS3mg117_1923 [Geminicoccaceae bacterium]